jgi:hypothetical protein
MIHGKHIGPGSKTPVGEEPTMRIHKKAWTRQGFRLAAASLGVGVGIFTQCADAAIIVGPGTSNSSAGPDSYTYTTGTGAFTYTYNAYQGADPNVVISPGATYKSSNDYPDSGLGYYCTTSAATSPDSPTSGTISYTVTATPGSTFVGDASIAQLALVWSANSPDATAGITGVVNVTGGENSGSHTFYTYYPGTAGPASYDSSNSFDVAGANTFTITYTLTNDNNNFNFVQVFRDDSNNDDPTIISGQTTLTPEPATLWLLSLSALSLLRRRRAVVA